MAITTTDPVTLGVGLEPASKLLYSLLLWARSPTAGFTPVEVLTPDRPWPAGEAFTAAHCRIGALRTDEKARRDAAHPFVVDCTWVVELAVPDTMVRSAGHALAKAADTVRTALLMRSAIDDENGLLLRALTCQSDLDLQASESPDIQIATLQCTGDLRRDGR